MLLPCLDSMASSRLFQPMLTLFACEPSVPAGLQVIELVKRAHTRCELTILQNNGVPAMGPPSLDDGSRKLNLCGRTMFCQCPRCRKVPGSVDYLALRPTAAG